MVGSRPPLSLSTITLPGVYSVMVPLPSVVLVVVVVSETCAHVKGAVITRAILTSIFFIYFPLSVVGGQTLHDQRFSSMKRIPRFHMH
jgi:hypothetical protein